MSTPHYIAQFDESSGLNRYFEPFLIPEKAYTVMRNLQIYRGKIRRKPGYSLLGRLRRLVTIVALPNTTGGNPYTVADILALASSFSRAVEANAEIQIGTLVVTFDFGGANQTIYTDAATPGILTRTSGPFLGSGTINYLTGALSITFSVVPGAGIAVRYDAAYYPNLPVMGLFNRETVTGINLETLIAFDIRYGYIFSGGVFSRLPAASVPFWQGNNSDLFWVIDYWQSGGNVLTWITNFNKGATPDPIRYFDGTTTVVVNPQIDTAGTPNRLQQARCIIPYKGRLLMMNTWEGTTLAAATQNPQRIRWSQSGDPTTLATSWLSDTPGRGGFLDLPTSEQIISCYFIKDILLVKCERSSWKLTFTGDPVSPFIPQRINAEMGSESTFSLIPFDKGVLGSSQVGFTVDDGIDVARIDEAIPDLSFDINNDNNGVKRVYGIRDYGQQTAYWAYPNSAQNPTFPNRVLAYNYISSNWFIYEDSFTTFGYYQPTSDLTWATLPYPTWEAWTDPWNSGTAQAGYPEVVAGNQTGGVVVIDRGTWNDFSYAIANISGSALITVNVPNHNLESGWFVRFSGIVSTNTAITNFLNGPIYQVNVLTANTFSIAAYNSTTGQFINVSIVGSYTYLGGGLMGTCPKPVLKSKFFCPFYENGTAMRVDRIDYYMDRTAVGEVVANIYINDNTNSSVNDPADPNNSAIMGDNTVTTYPSSFYPYQATQPRIWHPTYPNVKCQSFQYELTLNNRQMSTPNIYGEPIVLHATIFYAQPAGRLNP